MLLSKCTGYVLFMHNMRAYEGVELEFHAFLTTPLYGGKW